jgi:hypothetical protein
VRNETGLEAPARNPIKGPMGAGTHAREGNPTTGSKHNIPTCTTVAKRKLKRLSLCDHVHTEINIQLVKYVRDYCP